MADFGGFRILGNDTIKNMTNSTPAHFQEDDARWCYVEHHVEVCVRLSVMLLLTVVTTIAVLLRLVQYHWYRSRSYSQYTIYYTGLLLCVLSIIHWAYISSAVIDFFLTFLVVIQLIVIAQFFCSWAARILKYENILKVILYGVLLALLLYFFAVTAWAIFRLQSDKQECTQIQWLLFSTSQLLVVQLFFAAVIYISRKLSQITTTRSNRLSQKAQLWGLVIVYQLVTVVTFSYDLALLITRLRDDDCRTFFTSNNAAIVAIYIIHSGVKYLAPQWGICIIFSPLKQTRMSNENYQSTFYRRNSQDSSEPEPLFPKSLPSVKCTPPSYTTSASSYGGTATLPRQLSVHSPYGSSSPWLKTRPGQAFPTHQALLQSGKEDFRGAASATEHVSVGEVLSLDGSGGRSWGSWRERSRKDPGSPQEGPSKSANIPAHIRSTSPTSAYLLSSGIAAGDTSDAEVTSTTDENPPYIYFSLYFDIQRRALMVNLIKVENLPPKPPNQGSCDPFVMLFLLPNKQEVLQSVVKQRTLNPEFQQVFEFGGILANDLKNQVLVFRVFDHDRFSKKDLMGTVIMPLKDADLYGVLMRRPVDQRKGLLKQLSAGDLLFSLMYSEERRVINGIILKATNLRKAGIWGLADPYVKIYMIHESKRMNKWKTEVKKNTLVPVYNESFQFDVSGLDIRNISLEIWVMDHDWFSRNDKMGVVYVGANSPQEVGRKHWMEIISAPEHQTSHWHTIIPYTDQKQVLPLAKQQLQQRQLQVQQQQQQGQHKQQQRQHKQQQHRRQRQRGVQ